MANETPVFRIDGYTIKLSRERELITARFYSGKNLGPQDFDFYQVYNVWGISSPLEYVKERIEKRVQELSKNVNL